MKKFTILMVVAIFTMALIGCETIPENNNTNNAIVTDDNMNANMMNMNMANDSAMMDDDWDADITRETYDKDKDLYATRAEKMDDNIGSGAEDGWLWTKTRTALMTTEDLRESTLNVDVNNNVVTLRGTVGTKAQMDKAYKVASEIDGVTSVKNEMKVAPGDSMTNMNSDTDNMTTNTNMKNDN